MLGLQVGEPMSRQLLSGPLHPLELPPRPLLHGQNACAGGIVVLDLRTRAVKWEVHLDLSTDTTRYRAYIWASPTLVDLDADGQLEVCMYQRFAVDGQRPPSLAQMQRLCCAVMRPRPTTTRLCTSIRRPCWWNWTTTTR